MPYRVITWVVLTSLLLAACGTFAPKQGAPDTTPGASGASPYPVATELAAESGNPYPAAVEATTQQPDPYPASGVEVTNAVSLADYVNNELKYLLSYPVDWQVNEDGLSQPNKEVIFTPADAAAFTTYFSVLLDERDLENIRQVYQDTLPEAVFSEVTFAGQPAIMYTMENRVEVYASYQDQVYLIYSDQPTDQRVSSMLSSFQFLP
jgi:hypothetical protein